MFLVFLSAEENLQMIKKGEKAQAALNRGIYRQRELEKKEDEKLEKLVMS